MEDPALTDYAVRALFRDSRDHLWAGTETALFEQIAGQWQEISLPNTDSVFVASVIELPNGDIVVGTYGDGLFIKQRSIGWRHLTTRNGLPFQDLFSVTANDEYLWATSGSGVFKLSLAALVNGKIDAEVLIRDDGSFPNRNRLRCCNGAGNNRSALFDGQLLAPTLQGVLSLPVDYSAPDRHDVIIAAVLHQNQRLEWNESVSLPSDLRDIDIGFTLPVFGSDDLPEFRYRLLPSQGEWVYPAGRKVAYFTNLPPGESLFEIQVRTGSHEWRDGPSLKIEVEPLFIETTQFKLLVVITLIIAGIMLVKLFTRGLKLRAEQLEQLVTARTADYERVNAALLESNKELQKAAVTDALTGLRNRRFLQEQLATMLAGVNRRQSANGPNDSVCAVILLDLDYFKQINDTFGHDKGDEVLVAAARALNSAARAEDYLLRWGGEEFLLVIPDISPRYIRFVHERLHNALSDIATKAQLDREVTISAGIACLPWGGIDVDIKTWEHALELADLGLYEVKAMGRNGSGMVQISAAMAAVDDWSAEGLELARLEGKWGIEIWQGQNLVK